MLFSSRLPESLELNEFTKILEEKKATGHKILDLTQANPTTAGFAFASAIPLPSISDVSHRYEPAAQGMKGAREAIRGYYRDNKHGLIDSDDLLLTASTSEAYSYLMKLLTDPGDEILIPAPSYPLFDFLATLENVRPSRYLLRQDAAGHWRIDFTSLEQEISRLTRAIVVVNPNNPTGSYMTAEELKKLSDLCQAHELALIVDEVFLDYENLGGPEKPCSAIASDTTLTFTLSGFSKILALPQAKLSWIHVHGPEPTKAMAKQRLEFIADTYLSVGSIIQHAAASLFSCQGAIQKEILDRIQANESLLLAEIGVDPSLREGGWYAIINLPENVSDEECCLDLLQQSSLIVHPGYFYDFVESNRIVVSLITPEEDFRQGLLLLQSYLNSQHDR
ncbi:MAG: pyridoxal phosphate-dependent aminotransferase [Proteobacteria bacterium]|nr:pyridoxal phosphate-dependent aminotransferase [Pseudomonadota bacterium]